MITLLPADTVESLIEQLRSSNARVRLSAIFRLRDFGDRGRDAVKPLGNVIVEAVTLEDAHLLSEAMQTLEKIGGAPSIHIWNYIIEFSHIHSAITFAIRELGSIEGGKAIASLGNVILKSRDSIHQEEAFEAINNAKASTLARKWVFQQVGILSKNPAIKRKAVLALAKIGGDTVAHALEQVALYCRDFETTTAAITALEEIGTPEAVEELKVIRSISPDNEHQTHARNAIRNILDPRVTTRTANFVLGP